ncbi:hypothetical protein FKW77_005184 [Venturia effusa]|uniref:Uncharacterized protein n=1 Tax=Venturia effusa TaxID=50376 RepID=A0A517LCC9_9PEZI|nr:hypothetical protein FKW77_005184 [Venturia effusa]
MANRPFQPRISPIREAKDSDDDDQSAGTPNKNKSVGKGKIMDNASEPTFEKTEDPNGSSSPHNGSEMLAGSNENAPPSTGDLIITPNTSRGPQSNPGKASQPLEATATNTDASTIPYTKTPKGKRSLQSLKAFAEKGATMLARIKFDGDDKPFFRKSVRKTPPTPPQSREEAKHK